jgi:hypothetical protein
LESIPGPHKHLKIRAQVNITTVERFYCKRPILCMASSKILTPHPLTARRGGECVVCTPPPLVGGRTNSLKRGVGGQYFGRRQTQLCNLYFVTTTLLYLSYMLFLKYVPYPLGPFPAAASLDAPVPRDPSHSGRPGAARRSGQNIIFIKR